MTKLELLDSILEDLARISAYTPSSMVAKTHMKYEEMRKQEGSKEQSIESHKAEASKTVGG